MALGKKVAVIHWEWGRNSAPRDGRKSPAYARLTDSFLYDLCQEGRDVHLDMS